MILIPISNCVYGQFLEKPNTFGECWEQCKKPNLFEYTKVYIPIYVGKDQIIESQYTKDTSILIKPQITEMDHKRENSNEFCLVKKSPEFIKINYYLTDTTITNEYYIEEIEILKLKEKGGNLFWYEVICKDDLTKDKIEKIQLKLIELGIVTEFNKPTGTLGSLWMNKLMLFQQENELPVGNLNLLTLDYIGAEK